MPKIALTDITLRNLPPPQKGQQDIWDAGFPAFGVRVSQGGSKTFVLNIHNSRRAIGRYPVISLAQARSEARRMLAEKTLGKKRPVSITYQEALSLFSCPRSKRRADQIPIKTTSTDWPRTSISRASSPTSATTRWRGVSPKYQRSSSRITRCPWPRRSLRGATIAATLTTTHAGDCPHMARSRAVAS
jgi:hypothetical protein